MNAAIEIVAATPDDAPELGKLVIKAMAYDVSNAALWKKTSDPKGPEKFLESLFAARSFQPSASNYKAVVKATGQLVGWICVAILDAGWADAVPAMATHGPPSEVVNFDFAKELFGKADEIHEQYYRGKSHAHLRSFFVDPEHQGSRIGMGLLEHAVENHRMYEKETYLNCLARTRNLYRKWGWKDIDHYDIDLSEWLGKYRGYGIHRTWAMVRKPGEWIYDPNIPRE